MKPDFDQRQGTIQSPVQDNKTGLQLNTRGITFSSPEQYLLALTPTDQPVWVQRADEQTYSVSLTPGNQEMVAYLPPLTIHTLGSRSFQDTYHTRYAYYAGAMANGISSEEMIISLGMAGLMGSFGSGGLLPDRIEQAIHTIQTSLGNKPYAFNLLNSPNEPALEQKAVELFIRYQVPVIEASAYIALTPNLVWYRVSGLHRQLDGSIGSDHHVIAKVSRKEIAKRLLEPASQEVVQR